MSDISQLASRWRGGGNWGTKVPISLHYLAQGGGGCVPSPPLGTAYGRKPVGAAQRERKWSICESTAALGALDDPLVAGLARQST